MLNNYENGNVCTIKNVLEKNRETLHILTEAFQDEQLCLILGAGISANSEIPMWSDIVARLMRKLVEKSFVDQKTILSKEALDSILNLNNLRQGNSPLTQMRYIKMGFTNDEFYQILQELLYGKGLNIETDILYSIAYLCKSACGYSFSRIKKIITYNFDSLLEKSLDALNIKYHIICNNENRNKEDNLTIYHVHGYLPHNQTKPQSEIIFSEEDYHRIYNDPYNWSNVVQLNSFRENTCLFVGCSMTDPNIRRLLDSANNKEKKHYAIMKRNYNYDLLDSVDDNQIIERYKKIDGELLSLFYDSIGIKIIWVDEFSEIPIILRGISKKHSL